MESSARQLAGPAADRHYVPDGLEEISAIIDSATGLHNRQYFDRRISSLISLHKTDAASFAVVIIDIDRFKPISDLFGGNAGDEILQQVGSRLESGMGPDCTVARIGADEFGVIIPLIENKGEIDERVRRVLAAVSMPYDIRNRTVRLTASAGCSLFRPHTDTVEAVLNKARMALYHARQKGYGLFVLYSAEMEQAVKTTTRIEQALRRAVAADELEAQFQPIVDLRSRRIVGFEALARWTDPEIGLVAPLTFIPIAEERGFISEVARNVLRKAAIAARSWPDDIYLSFNLSPSQLVDEKTMAQIEGILDSTGFDPRRLEIEMTETGLTTDPRSAVKIIEDLRALGIRIALDDFGTGQSSLGRLRDFRFDKLKIDRSFVSSMLEDEASAHIVRAIVTLCEGLRLGAIAEGIEQEEQAQLLLKLGCTEGQGFLFGEPVDAASARDLVTVDEGCLPMTLPTTA